MRNKKPKKVTIKNVPLCGKDKRGFVWEWKFSDHRQVTVYYRKKGEHFAHHYHLGKDPSKDPERFFLLRGRVRLVWWNPNSPKKFTQLIHEGYEIIIPVMVRHCFDAIEDSYFIEYRITHFDPKNPDIVPLNSQHHR